MDNTQRKIQGSAVAVIGGAGFLGSHLVDYLLEELNCNVLVIDNLISGRKEFINKAARFEYADITGSEEYMLKLFKHYKIEYVFNYAAEPYIPVSFARPLHVFNINAFAALKVINAAQEAGVKAILQVSSAEIYGNSRKGKISELEPVEPHSTYGAAKAAIDAMVQVRYKEAKTPVIALRQFNCIGARETHPYILPEIIEQVSGQIDGAPVAAVVKVRLGNNSFRDFQYAGDAVRMAVELLENGEFGEVYNMGSEEGILMYDLAELVGELMGAQGLVVEQDEARVRPWEIWHLQSDNTKLYNTIKYRPRTSMRDAVSKAIEYYRANGNTWAF
jgi:nucleoside-diphosphate-sugar epimerase